jgi:hypothetical protein
MDFYLLYEAPLMVNVLNSLQANRATRINILLETSEFAVIPAVYMNHLKDGDSNWFNDRDLLISSLGRFRAD